MRFWLSLVLMFVAEVGFAKPNILLVIADDMGVDASPCHAGASELVRMPTLKALCAQGMVFDNAYAAPTCSPTRATLMTGRYGFRTGIGAALTPRNQARLDPGERTLFDQMSKAGYASALIGKWHLTADGTDYTHPAELGVPYYFGLFSGGVTDYSQWQAVENGKRVAVERYATSELSDRAIDWIAAQSEPWFLWLAYNAPHTPFHLPPEELHSFGGLAEDDASIRRAPAPYYFAALEALDRELGRVLGAMDDATRANTVVVFIGDNGTPTRVLGAQMRGRAKGSLYEGGVHVPLVISGPDVATGRSAALVNSTDLYATILDYAGVASSAEDSISLRPVLAGGSGKRAHVYVEQFSQSVPKGPGKLGWAIRDARYKLLQLDGQAPMLFDLQSDPGEHRDLLRSATPEASAIAQMLSEKRAALGK